MEAGVQPLLGVERQRGGSKGKEDTGANQPGGQLGHMGVGNSLCEVGLTILQGGFHMKLGLVVEGDVWKVARLRAWVVLKGREAGALHGDNTDQRELKCVQDSEEFLRPQMHYQLKWVE